MEAIFDFLSRDLARSAAVLALIAFVLSCIAVIWMARSIGLQLKHQRLMVRPACWLSLVDNGEHIKICLQNNGLGPMVISEVVVADGKEKRPNLIDWMPPGIGWETFVSSFGDRSLPGGQELCILELKGDPEQTQFRIQRDSVRSKLARLTVTVRYQDVYRKRMPRFQRKLSWFGRNEDRLV